MPPRSKIANLPPEVKAWLDAALIENSFGGYEMIEAALAERGYTIGKSSIHRYGTEFEKKMQNLKLASEQARAIVQASPDDDGAVNEALMRLVQEQLFQQLLDFKADPDKPINLAAAAKACADLARATVTQKKWQAEVREKMDKKFAELETEAKTGKAGFDVEALRRVREELYGIV